jgi:hypothetical protein
MKIRLHRSEHLDDWFTLVRAEHDGRAWFEPTSPNSSRFMSSERLSPEACIEGDSHEMRAVADAIQRRESVFFKRIAVHFESDGAHFCSPKNSEHDAIVTLEEADDLAAQIVAELGVSA